MGTRDAILAEARSWLRTPYHHQGFVKGAGVDCAFLLICVYHAVGVIPWIDPRPYPPDWHFHRDEERYLGWVEQYCEQVEQPKPGDIAVFRIGRCISHGAIVVDYPNCIHSYTRRGVEYINAENSELSGRLHSFWSPKGIA